MISTYEISVVAELPSLGEEPSTLAAFKRHAGLPVDPDWTESDTLLKSYLLSAEIYVNAQTSKPYRPTDFIEKHRAVCRDSSGHQILQLHRWPISPTNFSLVSIDEDAVETAYTSDDYTLANGWKPAIVFKKSFVAPTPPDVLYPWRVSYTAGGQQNAMQLIAIFQLATYYNRFPEAIGKPVPDSVFQSHLDVCCAGGFL